MREARCGGACAVLVCGLLPVAAAQTAEATWRGKPRPLDELAKTLGEAPVAAARPWASWNEPPEHTDWHLALKQMWKHRDELRIEEVAGWNVRLGFDRDAALFAFGAARFLAMEVPKRMPALLRELSEQTVEQGKVTVESNGWDEDRTWTLPPDYVLPPAAQLAILQKHAGADVLARISSAFEKGAGYRR